jgi:hypothetical protein
MWVQQAQGHQNTSVFRKGSLRCYLRKWLYSTCGVGSALITSSAAVSLLQETSEGLKFSPLMWWAQGSCPRFEETNSLLRAATLQFIKWVCFALCPWHSAIMGQWSLHSSPPVGVWGMGRLSGEHQERTPDTGYVPADNTSAFPGNIHRNT